MIVYAGTSGWSYTWWKPSFYPPELKASDWLSYYSSHLPAVEINNSFYRLPSVAMVKRWRAIVPDQFRFAAKAWRGITHFKRLKDCDEELKKFIETIEELGKRLSIVLFQLPPSLEYDAELLKDFLERVHLHCPYAIEFRNDSWYRDDTYTILNQYKVALVHAHMQEWTTPRVVTAPLAYIRLHGATGLFTGSYDQAFLESLAEWFESHKLQTAHIYFNNTDANAVAVYNAQRMLSLMRRRS